MPNIQEARNTLLCSVIVFTHRSRWDLSHLAGCETIIGTIDSGGAFEVWKVDHPFLESMAKAICCLIILGLLSSGVASFWNQEGHNLRILFKLLLYVFKCSQGRAPNYLSELLSAYAPGREGLRSSSDKTLLSQPKALKAAGLNTFSVSGPREWNKLPKTIRESPSIPVFRKKLKTHLFS